MNTPTPKQTIPMKEVRNDRKTTLTHDFIPKHKYEVIVRAIGEDGQQQAMESAARNTIVIQGKLDSPSAPSGLVATGYLNAISLTWTNPTNYDFSHVEIWRSSINDISTYAEFSSAFNQPEFNHGAIIESAGAKIAIAFGTTYIDVVGEPNVTWYYWIKAVNTSQGVSDYHPGITEGVSGTTLGVVATDIDDFSITATKMFNKTIILDGDSWTDNSPGAGSIAWNAHVIVYQGASYSIVAGSTADQYVYWDGSSGSYSTATAHPDLSGNGFMIAVNRSGVHELVWNSSANMIIGNAYIANLNADKINAGTLTGRTVQTDSGLPGHYKRIELDVSDNTFRMYIDVDGVDTNIITIDDNLVGSRPGMYIDKAGEGGVVFLKNTLTEFAWMEDGSIFISSDARGNLFRGEKNNSIDGAIFRARIPVGETGDFIRGEHPFNTDTFKVNEKGEAYFAGYIDNAKSRRTEIGGYAVKLTNKTGGNTTQGQLVTVYTASAIDDAFKVIAINDDATFGIVLETGVADGSEAWIVTGGIAAVLMDAGGSARGDRIISSGNIAGSADVWNVGGAVDTHFQEIGHCLESRGGAGLARCALHFN